MNIFKSISVIIIIITCCISCSYKSLKPISYNCPKIELPDDPIIPLKNINEQSKSDEVIKAWVVTAYLYREWNIVVREQIDETNG